MNLHLFEGGSFLENIREYSERFDGLVSLQRQLLSDICRGNAPTINTLNDGVLQIPIAIRQRKLLIVLDDVDEVEQLDAIFGMMRDKFHQGSKIIITTRNVHLLKAYEHCRRYAVKKLNFSDSLELFSWHAFRESHPPEHYKEQSERIVKQCQGLPLALEVLGASLQGKKVEVWRSATEKLEIIPHCKIQKILRISYDSLQDDHDRDLFLEIGCFFNGEAKSYVVGILDECKYYTVIGIENLIDRCLLKIDKYKKLRMHHSIQSMGREIIRQQSPKDPGKRSRLWHFRDSLEVLKDETGTRAIEGLALDMNMTNAQTTELRTEAFAIMHKLRLLKINNVELRGGYKDFPKNLKWLCWHGCPSRSLPNDFPCRSLVALDMQSSNLKNLGQGHMLLGSLKFLDLSHCHSLVKTPDFKNLSALEQLILEDCINLIEIDESIGYAEGLVLLNLKDCRLLKKLPKNFGRLKLLETLVISGCCNLGMLPAGMREMKLLKVFHADGLDFSNSSHNAQRKESWREFIWGLVSKPIVSPQLALTSLPSSSITSLSLVNCNLHDNAFPKDFCVVPSLEYLNLSRNPIRFLPDCFKGLKVVKWLKLKECNRLQALEDLPNIKMLSALYCPLLEKITFESGMSLEGLAFPWGCDKLLEMGKVFKFVPIGNIDPEFINDCGIYDVESRKRIRIRLLNNYTHKETSCLIQGVYENHRSTEVFRGKSFSIFYPGSSVPVWFTSQAHAPSISFVVSHSKPRYLNTCIIYKLVSDRRQYFYMVINNRTKHRITIYRPSCYGIPRGDDYMTWLSHWEFNSHDLDSGDEVSISVFTHTFYPSFEVKEVGVHLVYEEEEHADIHPAKRLKIQPACDESSEYIIPVAENPQGHRATTQVYFLGCINEYTDLLAKAVLENTLEVESVESIQGLIV
ncbi:disease resistance protein RPV1-like [Daucus carota subsp. sativus]